MYDIIRDSTIGQLINTASRGRLLPYTDQKPDYVVPDAYQPPSSRVPSRPVSISHHSSASNREKTNTTVATSPVISPPVAHEPAIVTENTSVHTLERENTIESSGPFVPSRTQTHTGDSETVGGLEAGNVSGTTFRGDASGEKFPSVREKSSYQLVDWDGPNDQDNPRCD